MLINYETEKISVAKKKDMKSVCMWNDRDSFVEIRVLFVMLAIEYM
jgi:hypothetical protein